MQGSEVRVNFVVMRAAETQEEGGSSREGQHSRAARRPEPQYFRRHSTYVKVLLKVVKPMLKVIISTLIWTLVVLVSVSYKYWMWLYTQCNSNDYSFESPTCTIHCQWKQTATHRFGEKRWEQTPASLRGDESPSPGPPSVLIKRPGCCSFCHYRPTVLLFLAVSLRGRGSKLVTVSFLLQCRACSSCWGGGGRSLTSPRASLLMVYRLQRETRRLVEAVTFHTFFPTRA